MQSVSKETNQRYLLDEQYKDASNLDARVRLHQLYSTNKLGWHRWVFEQLNLPAYSHILELGCGAGYLWRENRSRTLEGWEITFSDLSLGMVQEAHRNLGGEQCRFRFVALDSQHIPFASETFDAVISNHMLYHVPDKARALSEIRRVLRPGGSFYATTVGQAHLRELNVLIGSLGPAEASWGATTFNLENGAELLSQWFPQVTMLRYEDSLVVTEAGALIAYVQSGGFGLPSASLTDFTRAVEEEIAAHGAFRITKDSGLFEATADSGIHLPGAR